MKLTPSVNTELKRRVHARMAETGEDFAVARRRILAADYYLCGAHTRGRAPNDPIYYDPACSECRRLLAEGKRTGFEPLPPRRGKGKARELMKMAYLEASAKKATTSSKDKP